MVGLLVLLGIWIFIVVVIWRMGNNVSEPQPGLGTFTWGRARYGPRLGTPESLGSQDPAHLAQRHNQRYHSRQSREG